MKLLDLMPAAAAPQDEFRTTSVMTYELGSLIRALLRRKHRRAQGNEKSASAYESEAKLEAADLRTQFTVLCEQMGWREAELVNIGLERFKERMKEIASGTL